MKRLFLLAIVSVFNLNFSFSQGIEIQRFTLNFESRNFESFTVFMDGNVVNRMPQSRVMVNDVSNQAHEVVVVMKSPEQKAAVLQLLPGEPVVTIYVDYDTRLEKLSLYTPSYNLVRKNLIDYGEMKENQEDVQGVRMIDSDLSLSDSMGAQQKLVTEEDLVAMMLRMKSQSFDSDRLALAKVIVASSSLRADQIGRLASLLDFSASQVELLKYAYGYCVDPQNYFKAIDILTFNSDKRKVMDFIATQ